jgi:predicted DNA-binding WGR domain protein
LLRVFIGHIFSKKQDDDEVSAKGAKAAKSGGGGGGGKTAHESRRIAVDRGVTFDATVYPGHGVMLNQTNVGNNNNKFYVIQLLDAGTGRYAVWTRWGRVGENGQNALKQVCFCVALLCCCDEFKIKGFVS